MLSGLSARLFKTPFALQRYHDKVCIWSKLCEKSKIGKGFLSLSLSLVQFDRKIRISPISFSPIQTLRLSLQSVFINMISCHFMKSFVCFIEDLILHFWQMWFYFNHFDQISYHYPIKEQWKYWSPAWNIKRSTEKIFFSFNLYNWYLSTQC